MSLLAPGKPSADDGDRMLTQGCFVGDVDKLSAPEDSVHATSLVCTSRGSVFAVQKHDLQVFLQENPGILMSLSGKLYVR